MLRSFRLFQNQSQFNLVSKQAKNCQLSRWTRSVEGRSVEGRSFYSVPEGLNPFMPTVAFSHPTFAVRETDVSRHNGGTSGAPLKPLRDDSALRALSSLRGLRGAP